MLAPAARPAIGSRVFRPVRTRDNIPPLAIAPMDDRRERLTEPLIGATLVYPRNSEIFGEGEPAEFLYRAASGCVRTCKILSDGRRQIGGFYPLGEVFGVTVAGFLLEMADRVGPGNDFELPM